MNNWRPKEWDNPYSCDKKLTKAWTEWFQSDAEIAFEAGADAMIEALRKTGDKVDNEEEVPILYYPPNKGIIVFIPDEEDK